MLKKIDLYILALKEGGKVKLDIQELIQKEKLNTDGVKDAQTSTAAKNMVTQGQLWIMIVESKKATWYIFSLWCSYYVTDIIKKLELCW